MISHVNYLTVLMVQSVSANNQLQWKDVLLLISPSDEIPVIKLF